MKKFLIITVSLIFISIALVVFFSDTIIKKNLEGILSKNINRSVKIADFDVSYLSGEINLDKIEINNKDFPGKLLVVDQAFAKLDLLSFYEDVIVIDNIMLDGIGLNYYFDLNNISKNNFTSLKKTLENKKSTNRKPDDKKFLIKQLDIKDINVSASSSKLNLSQTVKLSDMKFENLGNTKESKNYKAIAKKTIDKAYNELKRKLTSGAVDQNVIKDKIKDELKNKFKKILK
tara:strand:+ start:1223 stop:1918 length:696 start_codon:yes stop_codon:yes gene_type:complete